MKQINQKIRILFLCTANSCRSQMAEGWAKHLKSAEIEAYSAGIAPKGLDPLAVKVMKEVGIDISGQQSKHVAEVCDKEFDFVITLCGHAHEICPVFPINVRVIHHGFEDPAKLAKDAKTMEEKLQIYRKIRDQIKDFIATLPQSLIT